MTKLSELKAKRSAMVRPSPRCSRCSEFKLTTDGENYESICACGHVHAQPTNDYMSHVAADRLRREWRPDLAEALIATHNAADTLIEIAEAALAWDRAKQDKQAAIDALADVAVFDLDASTLPAQNAVTEASARVIQTKRDFLAALAKVQP